MKYIHNLLFLYIVCGTALFGNPVPETYKDPILSQMMGLSKSFTIGIFERVIEQAEIQKAHTLNSKNTFTPYTEIHKLYYRFHDFDTTVQVSKDRSYYYIIGKVFVSERYRELDYRTEHRNKETFKSDRDGFFYYCKLYYHERTRDFRLIIYPGFVQNICAPYMHFNKKTCPKHALVKYPEDSLAVIKTTPYSVHETSIRTIIEIPDALSEDFLVNNALSRPQKLTATTKFVEDMKEKHTQRNQQYNLNYQDWGPRKSRPYWSNSGFDWVNTTILNLFIFKNNTLNVSLNLSKQMKVFKIDLDNGLPKNLTLTSTKNANNEDFSNRTKYELAYQPFDSIKPLPSEKFIQSVDKGIINLVTSSFPDDKYLTGKNWAYRRFPFVKTGVASIDTCMGYADFEGCLLKAGEKLLQDSATNARKIAVAKDSIDKRIKRLAQIADDTTKITSDIQSSQLLLNTKETKLKELRKPFDDALLTKYLDSLLVAKRALDFTRLKGLKDVIPQLEEIRSRITSAVPADAVQDLYKNIRKLLEGWSKYTNPAAQLDDSPYKVKLNKTFFATSVKSDSLLNDNLYVKYDTDDIDTLSKSDLLTGLSKIIDKESEFNTWKQGFVEKFNEIKEYYDKVDSLSSKLRGYSTSLKGNSALGIKVSSEKDSFDKELLNLTGGRERFVKSSDEMKLANNFRETFLPEKVSGKKYFIYLDSITYDTLRKAYNNMGVMRSEQSPEEMLAKLGSLCKLFSESLYIRASLPEPTASILKNTGRTSNFSTFVKNQVLEVYEPYNINRLEIREKYKGRMTQEDLDRKKGWKGDYYQKVYTMLKKQDFFVVGTMEIDSLKKMPAPVDPIENHNTLWTLNFNGIDYRWLQISEELFREIKYINWFFSRYDKLKSKNKQMAFIRDLSKSI